MGVSVHQRFADLAGSSDELPRFGWSGVLVVAVMSDCADSPDIAIVTGV